MALHNLILPSVLSAHPYLFLTFLPVALLIIRSLYRLSPFHPLHHIPGPTLAKLDSLWLVYHAWIGDECTTIHSLHAKHGPLVRTGPTSVHISSGDALHDIYSGTPATQTSATGFLKPEFYSNFDVDGHVSIFSGQDPAHRAVRAKAVVGIFSTGALRKGQDVIDACVARFIARLQREKTRAQSTPGGAPGEIDVLNISRGLAIDTVTSYLFGRVYGGCDEDLPTGPDVSPTTHHHHQSPRLSASDMVDSFVAVGRFWYLPPWAFNLTARLLNTMTPNPAGDDSIARIDAFVSTTLAQPDHHPSTTPTFQTRLLTAAITPRETHAQCKDLIFAGTDSTAMNLATILHGLARTPTARVALAAELQAAGPADPQTLPYLRATVREGLRLALANPSRIPRVVPPAGWVFAGQRIPPGTLVGCSAFELHLNPDVFPDPYVFRPERWLLASEKALDRMNRDLIAFGLGPRQCIARNLATLELFLAVREVVKSGILEGSRPVDNTIDILEWFNSKVIREKIAIRWA